MKDFIMLFRYPQSIVQQASPGEVEAIEEKWGEWIRPLAAQGRVVPGGSRLANEGKVLKAGGVITDGPFVEIREMLGGFIIIKAESFDEALELAKGCPAVENGGSVELRLPFINHQ